MQIAWKTASSAWAPAEIVKEFSQGVDEYGPVAGTAKAAVKAVGEVVRGEAKHAVGAVETGYGIVEAVVPPLAGKLFAG